MSAEKIGAQHRARKAVLYVRQSSAHQVVHNRESRALQYAMRERLTQLGWSEIEDMMGLPFCQIYILTEVLQPNAASHALAQFTTNLTCTPRGEPSVFFREGACIFLLFGLQDLR